MSNVQLDMNKALKEFLNKIEGKTSDKEINFEDDTWRNSIPNESGWYLIKTNAPIEILRNLSKPKRYPNHTDIRKTIEETSVLSMNGVTISQSNRNNVYIIYSGETKNLRARAREHTKGHPNTYCLGLGKYKSLHQYKWFFSYVTASSCGVSLKDSDKVFRLAVEQGWRAKYGWPILCRK